MFTYNQMILATPMKILIGGNSILVNRVGDYKGQHYTEFQFTAVGDNGTRKEIIRIFEGDYAWVHCDCPWFKYTCEYALAAQGSSHILDGNGQPPTDRNPQLKPWICKHLAACFLNLRRSRILTV